MSQSVRYQVFLSSTFTDLKEERQEVLQALWELDCIPIGMEAFLAANESQWEVIKKVIDECDYYVLLIGGRYGSATPEGISYTEKEYNYAKSLKMPLLCFVHGDPGNIVASKVDKDKESRESLDAFRKRVMLERPVRDWTNASQLGGLVSRSLSRAIKVSPRPGWIRNTGTSSFELLEQVNTLTKENTELKSKTRNALEINVDELESGRDKIILSGRVKTTERKTLAKKSSYRTWKVSASWDDIFREIGPMLINEANENEITNSLARFVGWDQDIDRDEFSLSLASISRESFAEIIVQLRALGLMSRGTRKRAVSDNENYWVLTEKGDNYLTSILAKKKKPEQKETLISD